MKNKKLTRAVAGLMASLMLITGIDEFAFASSNINNASDSRICMTDIKDSISDNIVDVSEEEVNNLGAESENWKYFIRSSEDDKTITGVKTEYLTEKSFIIPASAKKIGDKAFSKCHSLTEVTFESGSKMTQIGESAFDGANTLSKIILPDSLKKIGKSAFEDTALTEIKIPKNVDTIDESAFEDVNSLEKIEFEAGSVIKVISEKAFKANNEKLTELILPETLEEIQSKAFSGYKNLREITIPENVKKIQSFAFSKCGIETVSVNSLLLSETQECIFSDCKINKIEFNPNITSIPAHMFEDAGFYKAVIEIPSKVTDIGEAAFKQNSLQEDDGIIVVHMGAAVRNIAKEAFYGNSISELALSSTLSTIGESAFQDCKKLTSVTIPEGIKTIDALAFRNCTSLKSVYLPKGMYKIVEKKDSDKNMRIPFDGCSKGLVFYVVKGSRGYTWCAGASRLDASKTNSFKYWGFEYQEAYAITYNLGKGAVNNEKNPGLHLGKENLKLYAPKRDGYKFLAWKKGSALYYPDDSGVTEIPVSTGKVKVKATWEKITYTVTFDPNGGTLKTTTKNYTIAKSVTFKKPKKAGFVFDGWYNGKVKVNKLKKGVYYGGDITLVAHWKDGSYIIRFDGNGATSGTMADITCGYSEERKLPKNKFKKEGYEFIGWTGKGSDGEVNLGDEDVAYQLKTKGTIVLKACWAKIE